MILITNPFNSELFIEVVLRLATLFAVGGVTLGVVSIKAKSGLNSELWKRYFSWLIIAPIFLLSVFGGVIPSVLIFGSIIVRAVKEFSTITSLSREFRGALKVLVPVSLAIVASPLPNSILPLLYIALFTIMAIRSNRPQSFNSLAIALFGAIWLIYLMIHAQLLRGEEGGALLLVYTGVAVALADIGSYTFGKFLYSKGLGETFPIASKISPNKTVLGYIGAFIGVAIVTALFFPLFGEFNLLFIVIITAALPMTAAVGDLGESLFKRFFSVKDSSQAIPGHGGVLDRLDSFIPAVTFVYYLNAIF